MARPRVLQRWWRAGLVLGATLALACVPLIISSLPTRDPDVPAAVLLARITRSAGIEFSGLAQSQGDLGLPDLPRTGQTSDLLGGIVRIREWWGGRDRWRVDQLSDAGELDDYSAPGGTLRWDSTSATVTHIIGVPSAHEPTAVDLTPPALGRRLAAGATGSALRRIGSKRLAGQTALGLRIVPPPGATTVGQIDIWSTASGLPLEVDVFPVGSSGAVVTTSFLSLHLGPPSAAVTRFVRPPGADSEATRAPDYVAADAGARPLPMTSLAGLPRTPLLSPSGSPTGVTTFGRGYALLAFIPLPFDIFRQAIGALQPPIGQRVDTGGVPVSEETLPLFHVAVGFSRLAGEPFLLVGTASRSSFQTAIEQLSGAAASGA